MSERLQLRRSLYEELKHGRGRRRKALRRQIHLLSSLPDKGPDDGSAGVREPRRPYPPHSPAAQPQP